MVLHRYVLIIVLTGLLKFIIIKCDDHDDTVKHVVSTFSVLWSDEKETFLKNYKGWKDFRAYTITDLNTKINDTLIYLATVLKYKTKLLEAGYNGSVANFYHVLKNAEFWLQDIYSFDQKVDNAYDDEKTIYINEWNIKMDGHWNAGMQTLVRISQTAQIDNKNSDDIEHWDSGGSASKISSEILIHAFLISFCIVL